ncbi:MFS transporter [Oerskovia flava]|uniref:MFS transporter n=1 Tax=Oerskovia flava TaxID=2986422 RepID=UPI002240B830|nr:MFS transporter [Oerskovia sp. JB1-3-2]
MAAHSSPAPGTPAAPLGPPVTATSPDTGTFTGTDGTSGPGREPRTYIPTLALTNVGIYLALLTPVMVTMAFKVQSIVGEERQAAVLGVVLGIGALFAMFSNPLAGRLSDRTASRFGRRRPWIVGGSVVGIAALWVVATATTVPVLVVGWCLAQASLNAALAATNATLPDQVPVARRGLASGLVGFGIPIAILTGSILAGAFTDELLRFVVPGVVALVTALLFAVFLKDRRLEHRPAARFGIKDFAGSFVFDVRKHPDFAWTWLSKFFVMFGYAGVATFMPYYLGTRFGLDEAATIAIIITANFASVGAMLVSSFLGGYLSDKVGKRRPFVAAAGLIMVVGLVLLAFAPSTGLVVLAQGIIGFGAGSFLSVDLALATQVLPDLDDTAKDLGVLNIANALPQSIAPLVAAPLLALGTAIGVGGYPFLYLVSALVAATGAVLVYRVKSVR